MKPNKYIILAVAIVALSAALPVFASAVGSASSPVSSLTSVIADLQADIASLSSLVSQGAASSTSSGASSENKPATGASITLELGDKSVLVALLQDALIKDGYLRTPATGVFDANTKTALEAFQESEGFPVTGYIVMTTSSIASSFAAAATPFTPIVIGTTGTRASAVQQLLIKSGLLKIATTTAYFGTETQAAVKAFQAAHGLPQTGVIDQATFAAMNGG